MTESVLHPSPAAPATPGSYGLAPRGPALPDATRLGPVALQVADLARSVRFYETVLGLRVVSPDGARDGTPDAAPAMLAAAHDPTDRPLVVLHERPGARPAPARGRLGLYHFAILLPDRASLGAFVRHAAALGVSLGAGDHLVSEAFYLHDPDGLGIEVYADRPRDAWRRRGRELLMATDPVDVPALLAAAGEAVWTGAPAGTVVGHVHLHVGDLDAAGAFYGDALGFTRMVWGYPGALFLGAGGYHHHLGTNVWAGAAARPAGDDDARLLAWTIALPARADVEAAAARVAAAGHRVAREGDDAFAVRDPWGTTVRVAVADREER